MRIRIKNNVLRREFFDSVDILNMKGWGIKSANILTNLIKQGRLIEQNDCLIASIMILTLGDSVSFLYGTFLGKIRLRFNKLKKLEGILAGMLAAFLGALVFVDFIEAFFSSLIAMIVEGAGFRIGVNDIDDNIIVPLVAGTVIYLFKTGFKVFII